MLNWQAYQSKQLLLNLIGDLSRTAIRPGMKKTTVDCSWCMVKLEDCGAGVSGAIAG